MKMNGRVRWATEEDVPQVWALILELAEYERAADQVRINADVLGRDGFGENPGYGLMVLEPHDRDEVVGMALFYEKYSTWNGRCLFLEDLVVTQSERGHGYGRQLFSAVAQETRKRGHAYMQWQVLDWNEQAIGFYKTLGASLDGEWLNGRLEGAALTQLAEG